MLNKIIHLKHNKKIRQRVDDQSNIFDLDKIAIDNAIVYSFSKIKSTNFNYTEEVVLVDGTTRFLEEHNSDIIAINFESLSMFAANIIWDLTHRMNVGSKIFIYEISDVGCILDTEYYNNKFEKIIDDRGCKVYIKKEVLLVEEDKGLSSWTFGIPVGPEEPTVLNNCVKRILELNIDDYEIILCGTPHKTFKYFDKVIIVGEDIPAPPVHITRKKNEIAKRSSKNNLCIIHDRVLLPLNFVDAINQFGDMFPLAGFQSIYFADYGNLIPRRYSDFGVLNNSIVNSSGKFYLDKNNLPYQMMDVGCAYQHCQRSDFKLQYLTGSLYLSKRKLWSFCPQNEDYYWEEYEDIEFALRAASKGIPSIINPYSFTQSINSRSIIHHYGYTTVKTKDGKTKLTRSWSEIVPFLPRKPLFRLSEDTAKNKMVAFVNKYCSDRRIISKINNTPFSGKNRYRLIFEIIMGSKIMEWKLDEFINDYCSLLLNENMHAVLKERLIKNYNDQFDDYSKKMVLLKNPFILNQLSNSFAKKVFMNEPSDILVKKHFYHKINSLIVAFFIKCFSKTFYFKMTIKEVSRIINDTTPFKED